MLKIRFKDKRKIAVFAHDAGAAELISSYLKSKKIPNIKFCLKGPAIKIFEKKFKYNWINLYSNTKFKFSQNKDIIKEILNNDIIVSCGSIALKIAEIFKKKIICSSPKNSNYFQLPIKNIRFLENVKKF